LRTQTTLRRLYPLLAMLPLGCGGGGDGDTNPAEPGACVEKHITVAGALDGENVDLSLAYTSFYFVNGSGGQLDVTYAGGALHLTLADLAAYGETVAASGTIQMPAGAPHAGEAICAGSASTITPLEEGYKFELAELSLGATCPGQVITGSLHGCAKSH
jgi:hypothetical protein